ncbi:MAG TPA: fimbria/pilus outer membrane usher protein [Geminicoccaceae bacterium]|nr:fimbria/pilus outer membrane usher protein [Geminicoccus sp.]HMU49062.1 fimbria/pilus outer membrane usher protein [Geminicoccaceae bacterium]
MASWPDRWPRPGARLGAALLLAAASPQALADEPSHAGAAPAPAVVTPVWPPRGGGPQPEPGPRRDPVDPPLLDAGAWNTWVLAVQLNGREVSQGSVVLEEPQYGRLVAPVSQLRLWRVRLDESRILAFQGEAFYPLDAIPGAEVGLDRAQLVLALQIPSAQLLPFDMAQESPDRPEPVAAAGGFFDYDMLLTAGTGIDTRLDGLAEIGVFNRLGVLTTGLQASDLAAAPSVTRLDTTFTRDLPERRESLRLGDSLTNSGSLAPPVRFAGVQWGTNFATDPSFVTFPTPAIGGLADQDSVVDVFVNNLRQATGQVPAGPFRIDNVPVVTGAGEVQLVVRDLLGRERIVTQPYYVSGRLLRAGLHDYSYELGFERQRYGERSFAYGDPLAAATHRYGISELLTGEVHADVQPGTVGGAVGASLRAGHLGVFSGGLGASVDEGSAGGMGQIAYEYQASRFSFGAQTRYATADFVQAGDGSHRTRRVDQLNLGFDLGDLGRVGVLALNQDNRERETTRSLAATYSLAVGPGSFLLRGAQFLEPESDWVVTVTYALPLGGTRSASVEVERSQHGQRARAQYRQGRGPSDLGLDYRLAAELGDEARNVDARFSYQTVHGAGELDLERFDDENNLRAGVSGSVGLVDGVVRPSRRIGRAFGMVATPGFSDVRVYLDNREVGRTDKAGYLMLPALRPYEANRVRLEVEDLPLDARIGSAEAVAVPFDRAGVAVDFDVRHERQATARLLDTDGRPLPAGLQLASEDGLASAWVAKSGFSRIVGGDGPVEVTGRDAMQRAWTCALPAVPADTTLPDLGGIVCR